MIPADVKTVSTNGMLGDEDDSRIGSKHERTMVGCTLRCEETNTKGWDLNTNISSGQLGRINGKHWAISRTTI